MNMLYIAQSENSEQGLSWLETIARGSEIGYVIIGLSVVAVALIVMHFIQIRRKALIPPEQLEAIDGMLASGNVKGSLEYCVNPDHDSYLTRILSGGLIRYQQSAFGAFEIKTAIEEAGEDQTAKLYRSTDALGVIGHIAPLLGLLGTVMGMVGAFETLSTGGATNHERMAGYISMALVTTLMGLFLAIPCIALFTFFRNRIDAFASEARMEIERLILHLESTPSSSSQAAQARPQPAPRPVVRDGSGVPAPGTAQSSGSRPT